MKRLKDYLQRIYRASLSPKKQEELVWGDLKKLHLKAEWRHGVYEQEKYIETRFEVFDGQIEKFAYFIYDSSFFCRYQLAENYPEDLTPDVFLLASHFNNVLNNGVVVVNANDKFVEHRMKNNILVPLLQTEEMYNQIMTHYNISRDVQAAFQRLVEENEAPAIIIADLMREYDKDSQETD
jgi:hypothetical protein